eukprot:gene6175-2535_t
MAAGVLEESPNGYRSTINEIIEAASDPKFHHHGKSPKWKELMDAGSNEDKFRLTQMRRVAVCYQDAVKAKHCPYCWTYQTLCMCTEMHKASIHPHKLILFMHPAEAFRLTNTGKILGLGCDAE